MNQNLMNQQQMNIQQAFQQQYQQQGIIPNNIQVTSSGMVINNNPMVASTGAVTTGTTSQQGMIRPSAFPMNNGINPPSVTTTNAAALQIMANFHPNQQNMIRPPLMPNQFQAQQPIPLPQQMNPQLLQQMMMRPVNNIQNSMVVVPSTNNETIQSILEINKTIFKILVDYQNNGWLDDPDHKIFQSRLHSNLAYLASVADSVLKPGSNVEDPRWRDKIPDLTPVDIPKRLLQLQKAKKLSNPITTEHDNEPPSKRRNSIKTNNSSGTDIKNQVDNSQLKSESVPVDMTLNDNSAISNKNLPALDAFQTKTDSSSPSTMDHNPPTAAPLQLPEAQNMKGVNNNDANSLSQNNMNSRHGNLLGQESDVNNHIQQQNLAIESIKGPPMAIDMNNQVGLDPLAYTPTPPMALPPQMAMNLPIGPGGVQPAIWASERAAHANMIKRLDIETQNIDKEAQSLSETQQRDRNKEAEVKSEVKLSSSISKDTNASDVSETKEVFNQHPQQQLEKKQEQLSPHQVDVEQLQRQNEIIHQHNQSQVIMSNVPPQNMKLYQSTFASAQQYEHQQKQTEEVELPLESDGLEVEYDRDDDENEERPSLDSLVNNSMDSFAKQDSEQKISSRPSQEMKSEQPVLTEEQLEDEEEDDDYLPQNDEEDDEEEEEDDDEPESEPAFPTPL